METTVEVTSKTMKRTTNYRKQTSKMITTLIAGSAYRVTGDKPLSIQEDLDSAVQLASLQAMKDGLHGILVTRLGPTSFTVTLSSDVPYGTTQESCQIQAVQQ